MTTLNAFVIDPYKETIEPVDLPANPDGTLRNFRDICAVLSTPEVPVHCFALAAFGARADKVRLEDRLYVDDEGLLKENAFFLIEGYVNHLAGRALVLGHNGEGDSVAPRTTLEQLKAWVRFVPPPGAKR